MVSVEGSFSLFGSLDDILIFVEDVDVELLVEHELGVGEGAEIGIGLGWWVSVDLDSSFLDCCNSNEDFCNRC